MKFNWGHKLILVFLVFGGMISYLVYRSMHTSFDLVSAEYYKDELAYQQVIDGASLANQLSGKTLIIQTGNHITIQLPNEMKGTAITGSILFYCATDAGKDKKIPLQMNADAMQDIDKRLIIPGNYIVKVSWDSNGQHYYSEQSFTIL